MLNQECYSGWCRNGPRIGEINTANGDDSDVSEGAVDVTLLWRHVHPRVVKNASAMSESSM